MLVDLPDPFEDETLYSVVARYVTYLRVSKLSSILEGLFGNPWYKGDPLLPRYLDRLARATGYAWGWSAEEIAWKLSAYNFFASFSDFFDANVYIQSASQSREICSGIKGWTRSQRRAPPRMCCQCYEEDIKNGITPYWRITHQLPGMLVCTKHESFLMAGAWSGRHSYWIAPTTVRPFVRPILAATTSTQTSNIMNVARIVQWLWRSNVNTTLPLERRQWLNFLRPYGYISDGEVLRNGLLLVDLNEFYGEMFLAMTFRHCALVGYENAKWNFIFSAYRKNSGENSFSARILVGILVGVFVGALQREGLAGSLPKCPNPSSSAHRKSAGPVRQRVYSQGRYRATCPCGMSFMYTAVSHDGTPLNVEVAPRTLDRVS